MTAVSVLSVSVTCKGMDSTKSSFCQRSDTDFLSQIKPSIQTWLQLHLVAFNKDIFFLPEPTQINLYCQLVSPFHVTKS